MLHEKRIKGIEAHGDLYALYLGWGGTDLQTTVKGERDGEEFYHKWIRKGYETYPLPKRIVKIGTNGHDWVNGVTVAVMADVDFADQHKAGGFTREQIQDCIDRTPDYASVYWSRQGEGITLVVILNLPAPTVLEHNQWAQRVKQKLKADGFPIERIDKIGFNSWMYWSEATGRAHTVIREATAPIGELPELERVAGPRVVNDVPLCPAMDAEHARILERMAESGYTCHVENDLEGNPLIHFHARAAVSEEFPLYQTNSGNSDPGKHNRWGRLLPSGRLLFGTYGNEEHESWSGPNGTHQYFVYGTPTLDDAVRITLQRDGAEYLGTVAQVADALQMVDVTMDVGSIGNTDAVLSRDGKQWVVKIGRGRGLDKPEGWVRNGDTLKFFVDGHADVAINAGFDLFAIVGNLVKGDPAEVGGYCVVHNGRAMFCDSQRKAEEWMNRHGQTKEQIATLVRNAKEARYRRKHLPAQLVDADPDVPGQYLINKTGARLRHPQPVSGSHPTWDELDRRIGRGLDAAVKADPWCKRHGITEGWQYLRLYRAIMLQEPYTMLPFLALFSPGGNAGKSFYFESFHLYIVKDGIAMGTNMLKKNSQFNAHVVGSLQMLVVEQDISGPAAANIIKTLATDKLQESEAKGKDSQLVEDACVKLALVCNKLLYIAIDSTDSRTVIIRVPQLETVIHESELGETLAAEASAYTHTLLNAPLPTERVGRFFLPVLNTPERQLRLAMFRQSPVELFAVNFVEEAESDLDGDVFRDAYNRWAGQMIGEDAVTKQSIFGRVDGYDINGDKKKRRLLNATLSPKWETWLAQYPLPVQPVRDEQPELDLAALAGLAL